LNFNATRSSRSAALRRLTEQALEAPDLDALARLLTRTLPSTLRVASATLLLWDRRLDTFQALIPGETRIRSLRPEDPGLPAPEARYLISDGRIIETREGRAEGALLPLMARSGLAGMLVLGPRAGRRKIPYRPAEVRLLSTLAARAALSLENHLYLRELVASERMAALGSMAGMLAHDLRGPMTVIRGYAETLAEGDVPREDVRARARTIVQMVDRLERMTAETLDFARGGGRLALRKVGLTIALADLFTGLALELPGLEIERHFDLPPAATAQLDLDKLARALGNMAANALQAMGGRGRLRVGACLQASGDPPRECLVLTLADEGPGVPAEARARGFEPFFSAGKKRGTGLGLAVTRRFVEDHGGTVELLPDGPGARFRVELPVAPTPAGP
jgi:signal transduction histidine kinase